LFELAARYRTAIVPEWRLFPFVLGICHGKESGTLGRRWEKVVPFLFDIYSKRVHLRDGS
jgi:hypothetical protein